MVVSSANFAAPCPLHFANKNSGHDLTSRKLRQSWNRSANPCTTTAGSQPANPSCPNCAYLPIQVFQIVQNCQSKLSKLCKFANPSCPICANLPIQSLQHYRRQPTCPAPKYLFRPTRLVLKDVPTSPKLIELCQWFPTLNSAQYKLSIP